MVMRIQMILTPDVENKNVYCCLGVKVGGGQEGWDVLMCSFFFFHMAIIVEGLGECG